MVSWLGHNVFTYNEQFKAHMTRLNPASLLFIDNDGGAADAANRLPNCKVIARVVSDKYEKELHLTKGEAVRYVQTRAAQTSRNVWINIGCEPPIDRLDLLVSEYIAACDYAEPRGIKLALPHAAVGGMWDNEFRVFMPLAERIARRPDLFLLTVDEYFAGVPFSGVQDTRLPAGNEAGHILPETWKRSNTGVYYHCGRIGRLFDMMTAAGKSLPLCVISEGGPDNLNDVQAWRESLVHTPPYPEIKGWRSLYNQWAIWGTPLGWTPQRYYIEGVKALRQEVYSLWPNVISYLLYVYGTNGDALWLQHDNRDTELLQRIEAFQIGVPPVATPIPDTPEVHARLKTLPGTTVRRNIRTENNSDSTDIGDLNIGDEVYWHSSPPAPSNGGWVYVRKVVGNISGWMSIVAGVTFETIVDTLPDSAEVALLKTQVATLTTQLATATAANTALQAANTGLVATLENREAVMAEAARDTRALDGKLEEIFTSLEAHTETI